MEGRKERRKAGRKEGRNERTGEKEGGRPTDARTDRPKERDDILFINMQNIWGRHFVKSKEENICVETGSQFHPNLFLSSSVKGIIYLSIYLSISIIQLSKTFIDKSKSTTYIAL